MYQSQTFDGLMKFSLPLDWSHQILSTCRTARTHRALFCVAENISHPPDPPAELCSFDVSLIDLIMYGEVGFACWICWASKPFQFKCSVISAHLQGLTKRHGSKACRACCKDNSGQGFKQENPDKPSVHGAFGIPTAGWTSSTVLQNTSKSPCKTWIIHECKSGSKGQSSCLENTEKATC